MKVDIQDVSPCRKTLKIEIPKEDVKAELDKIYEELRTTALVPGFRKGKAPQSILRMRFGEYVKGDVIEKLLLPAVDKAMEDSKLEVLRPIDPEDMKPPIDEISVKEDEPLVFEVTVDVRPSIVIPELGLLEVEKGDINVTKEDVDAYIHRLREDRASFVPVEDRPVQKDDYVTVSIHAASGDEVLEEQAEQTFEIGENTPLPEIAEYLIGMKTDDEKEFSISFPADYKAKDETSWRDIPLAEKEVKFSVKLNKITEKHLPALNDEFAKDLGEEDLQHLNAKIWNQLVEFGRQIQKMKQRNDLMNQLLEKSQFEVPEFLVEDQVKSMMKSDRQSPGKSGPEAEEELSQYHSSALDMIRRAWILSEIAKREEVSVSDEEVDTRVRAIAAGLNRDPQKYKKLLEDTNRIEGIKTAIWENKLFNLLIERASPKRTLIT